MQNTLEVKIEITSSTHHNFSLDCSPYFKIIQERYMYFITGVLTVGDQVDTDIWKQVDSFLAALSIVENGIFSRTIWTKGTKNNAIKWLTPPPRELAGTGIMVMQDNK